MFKVSFIKIVFFFFVPVAFFIPSCNPSGSDTATLQPKLSVADSIALVKKNKAISQKTKQLETVFKNRVAKDKFNGCVLVAQKGQIIYKNVFGYANLKTKDSLKINSEFQLASTSKTMTAAAILKLREQGKLKLTDDVRRYLPEFPYATITIQMLLTHRSGLSNYIYFGEPYCDANNCYNGKTFDNNALLDLIASTKPDLYYKPNKKFEYCNTNYALLASIIEKVSGTTYADFMEQNVFKPLEMNNTWVFGAKKDTVYKYKTIGHTAGGVIEKDTYADYVVGDKGIYSTIDDMFKWDNALYSGTFLKQETLEEAYKGYSNEHPGKRNYGYGWRLIEEEDNKVVYHNGWWHGYSSLFYRRISDQTTVIMLSNKFNSSTYHIEDILEVLNKGANEDSIAEVKRKK